MNFKLSFNCASLKRIIICVVASSWLLVVNAGAQVTTINPTLQAANKASFVAQLEKTIDQYTKQIQQYMLQIKQYQQLLFKAESLGTNFSIKPTTMQPIYDSSELIAANCGNGSTGGIVGSLVSNLASLVSQPVAQSQQAICGAIVTLQVDKYNQTVEALGTIESNAGALSKLADLVQSAENLGSSNDATSLVSAYSSQLQTRTTHWQAALKADDAAIDALQGQQVLLSKMALNGGGASTILSNALPDAAFEAAVHSIQ